MTAREPHQLINYSKRSAMQVSKLIPLMRVVGQLIIAGPIIVYFPFAVWIAIGSIWLAICGEVHEAQKSIAYGLGGIGLIGLYASILVPVRTFHRHVNARRLVIVCLWCGFIATGAMIFGGEEPDRFFDHPDSFHIWFFGGPVFVGLWNLGRLRQSSQKGDQL
jgi:hypothetical protein